MTLRANPLKTDAAAVRRALEEKGIVTKDVPWYSDAMIVENLPVKSVSLVSRRSGRGLRFDFGGFDALGLWTPDHTEAPFLCLEPWNGLPADVAETTDAKSKKYAITIEPGAEYVTGYRMTVIR